MTYDDALRRMLLALDKLEWAEARDYLADQVRVEFSAPAADEAQAGGEAEQSGTKAKTVTADDLIARWRKVLPGFDVTQYLANPPQTSHDERPGLLVDTDIAGFHHLGEDFWTVYGHCTARIEDDKITELAFQMSGQKGNPDLRTTAAQRAASSPRVLQH
jgi:hypothetical protein